jgi:hypothetical protein
VLDGSYEYYSSAFPGRAFIYESPHMRAFLIFWHRFQLGCSIPKPIMGVVWVCLCFVLASPKKKKVPSAFMLSYCDAFTCIIILKKSPHIEKHASALLVQPRWFN